jgi:predicted nuclease of restriction endonuclease-like RecB superfamily
LKKLALKKLRNKFETKIYRQLKKHKVLFNYELEKIPFVLARHYVPDFVVFTPNGKIYIETKGHLRREDKAKLVAIKRQHPEMDLRILFYSRKKDQISWADRHGFKYAFENIPEEWINGF